MYTKNKNGEIILQVDEIINQILTNSEGTFLYIDKEVLEEWVEEIMKVGAGVCE